MKTLEVIKKYNLSTKKKFGQNFLVDELLLDKIVNVAGDIENKNVLEIGPGPGGLTNSILKKNPKKLISIEIDRDLFRILETEFSNYNNFKVINEDALRVIEEDYFSGDINVVANLPYNVGTTLLIKWISNIKIFSSFTLLLQKEVVDRIIAKPSTKDYGRLSVIVQALCFVKKAFDVKPTSFIPPPKVMSSVVHIIPKENDVNINIKKLSTITLALFNQRRKKINKALENLINNNIISKEAFNLVDPNSRAEEVSVEQYIELSRL